MDYEIGIRLDNIEKMLVYLVDKLNEAEKKSGGKEDAKGK